MLNPRLVLLALPLQLLLLLLLQPGLNWWSSSVIALILAFKYQAVRRNKIIKMRTLNALAVLLCLLLISQLWQQNMQDSMLQLLFFSAALRLCSVATDKKQAKKLIWVQYFLIATALMLNQSLLYASAVFVLLLSNIYLHYLLFAPVSQPRPSPAEIKLFLLALPLSVVLFLIFPRLPPFWHIERPHTAQTGLADDLSLGMLEQLVQSDRLAFRVEFQGAVPETAELYWRAKVFEHFDGRNWSSDADPRPSPLSKAASRYSYQLMVEPHQQRSLFSLGQVQQMQGQVKAVSAGLVESKQPVSQRFAYALSSDGGTVKQQNAAEQRRNRIVQHSNPQASALASMLKQQHSSADQFANALYDYFGTHAFRYSLRPPVLDQKAQLDQFLFAHKVGFCGHYASAAAYLFRAAGFSARVVGGYQGGSWQAQGKYLQVLQKDAHAWVEYLDKGDWKRFDATAIVAPLRLTQGLSDALSLSDQQFLQQWLQPDVVLQWTQQLEWLDYYWSVWVLSFDQTEQLKIWQELKTIPWIECITAVLLVLPLLYGANRWLQDRGLPIRDRFRRELLRQLRPLGVKTDYQSLESWLRQLADSRPEQAALLRQLADSYQRMEFAEDQEQLQHCRKLLRRLKFEVKQSGLNTKN